MIDRRRSAWRFSVPLVCLVAGLLLAATHGVSGGTEIRRSDAPRLVDLVRRAQASVNRLATEREALTTRIDSVHGRSVDTALAAMQRRSAKLAGVAAMNPVHGPGLVVTLQDGQRDANGRFPRDASRTIWLCISKTSRLSSTRCGMPVLRRSRCRTSASSRCR